MAEDRGPVFYTLSGTGLFGALAMLWVALSPSLLPRPWLATAAIVGVSMAFGYALGRWVQSVWVAVTRELDLQITMREPWAHRLRIAWFVILGLLTVLAFLFSARRQSELERLTRHEGDGAWGQFGGTVAGIALFLVLLLVARGIGLATKKLRERLAKAFPLWLASLTALVVIVVLSVFVAQGVLIRPILESASKAATMVNFQQPPGVYQPTEETRSGSPGSTETWQELGAEGQLMVAAGPRAADIEQVTGRPAKDPIRVYAGLRDNQNITATVQAVIDELDRTSAWQRSTLLLVTSAGRGYVNEWSVAAMEYLTDGDCATASMQYSYLDSGWAYVIDRESPAVAGRALYDAVRERLDQMPEDRRPRLVLNGESLGSYGGQGAFDSAQDMIEGVDAAVWIGTPRFTPVWRDLAAARQLGSPEIAPVIDDGKVVRFVTSPAELERNFFGGPYDKWGDKRIVYVQHASDPVVWWSMELLWQEPDWMRESLGRDVSGSLNWMPWVTFWQLATDMPAAVQGPGGQGHQYHAELVPVWNAALNAQRSDRELDAIAKAIEPR